METRNWKSLIESAQYLNEIEGRLGAPIKGRVLGPQAMTPLPDDGFWSWMNEFHPNIQLFAGRHPDYGDSFSYINIWRGNYADWQSRQ